MSNFQRCIMGNDVICDGKSMCCERSQYHEDYMKRFPSPETIRKKYPDVTGVVSNTIFKSRTPIYRVRQITLAEYIILVICSKGACRSKCGKYFYCEFNGFKYNNYRPFSLRS